MNGLAMGVGCILGSMFGVLIGLYLILCLINWMSDIFDKTTWRWKK